MKKFFVLIWRILTAPYRALLWVLSGPRAVWHRIHLFFTEVPEDVSLTDTFTGAFGSREVLLDTFAALGEHLAALRGHVFRACIAMAITTGLSLFYVQKLMDIMSVPLGPGGSSRLQVIEPTEAIGVFM